MAGRASLDSVADEEQRVGFELAVDEQQRPLEQRERSSVEVASARSTMLARERGVLSQPLALAHRVAKAIGSPPKRRGLQVVAPIFRGFEHHHDRSDGGSAGVGPAGSGRQPCAGARFGRCTTA